MKLVWLEINASHAHSSLALPLLHHAGRGLTDVEWHVVRGTIHADIGALTADVIRRQPDVVAATLYLFNRRPVLDVLSRIHVLLPGCAVIVGGPECLGEHSGLLTRYPCIFAAVRGEGEAVFPALLEAIRNGAISPLPPGVSLRRPDGCIQESDSWAVATDWEHAPLPCTSPFFNTGKPFVQLETSRGCTRRCAYCSSCGQSPVRLKPLKTVNRELTLLRERGVREVRVLDRTFNADPERACKLLDLFVDSFADLQFHIEIHPEILPEALRRRLRGAAPDRLHVEAGLQTTSPAALQRVGRGGNPERALDGIAFLAACKGFRTHTDLLAGLPEQTFEDIYRDVVTLVRLGPAEIQLEVVKVLPGTPFRKHASNWGVRFSALPPYDVLQTPTMHHRQIRRSLQLADLLEAFYNPPPLHALTRRILCAAPERLQALLDHITASGFLDTPVSLKRRFRFLHDWSTREAPECMDPLRLAWIKAGLSPADALPRATPWKTPVPGNASWIFGDPTHAEKKKTRTWRLETRDAVYWFVYDRGQSRHLPVAGAKRVHTVPSTASPPEAHDATSDSRDP